MCGGWGRAVGKWGGRDGPKAISHVSCKENDSVRKVGADS